MNSTNLLARKPTTAALLAALFVAGNLSGCLPEGKASKPPVTLVTEFQAVHIDNGQVLFGKLDQAGADYPVLRDVFTAQNQVDPQTKEVTRALVRRSVELHGPDHIILNARHIVGIEPVVAGSRVDQVIRQAASAATSTTAK
jgi:hypothetical protein